MALSPTSFSANLSNDSTQQYSSCSTDIPYVSMIATYIMIISVLGIIFNVFVLMVFFFHKKPCTVADIYLGNLAGADLLLTSFLPFWAVYVRNKFNWTFGNAMCRLTNSAIIMSWYCSNYFLVLVSIDRYLALVHPLSHEPMRRPGFAKCGCLLVWGLGLLLSVPTIVYRKTKTNYSNVTICFLNLDKNAYLTFELVLITFGFVIPICIISFCTVKIIMALKNRMAEGVHAQKMKNKATTLVLVVFLVFLICSVPFHVMRILSLLSSYKIVPGCDFYRNVAYSRQFFSYLAFFSSILNPILYVVVGKNFRKKAKELFKQCNTQRTTGIAS
ncbi:B2 bradykinin receptor-like isoform X2 [Parambassis ranga]|uniref:B2 bradykinin receptor-like isoform X2 n=1 Tax=Parambassis ranga TaxID=210632 RepID=A0A6P7HIK4_9TELE|nr:B2 bradykinin receptor-like isoform X2 [Parambassis ranga]